MIWRFFGGAKDLPSKVHSRFEFQVGINMINDHQKLIWSFHEVKTIWFSSAVLAQNRMTEIRPSANLLTIDSTGWKC
jgi:hypothetical protein